MSNILLPSAIFYKIPLIFEYKQEPVFCRLSIGGKSEVEQMEMSNGDEFESVKRDSSTLSSVSTEGCKKEVLKPDISKFDYI